MSIINILFVILMQPCDHLHEKLLDEVFGGDDNFVLFFFFKKPMKIKVFTF